MQFQKPTSWAAVALLILLLGVAASFSLMGWNASGIGSNDFSLAGAIAMVCGVVAGVVLCVGLLSVVFDQRRASHSARRPVVSPPSFVASPKRRSEPPG